MVYSHHYCNKLTNFLGFFCRVENTDDSKNIKVELIDYAMEDQQTNLKQLCKNMLRSSQADANVTLASTAVSNILIFHISMCIS